MNRDRLLLVTVIMLAVAFLTSTAILAYYITHSQDLSASVQNSVQQELKKYNLPSNGKISVDDSKVILSIARYCSATGNCRGPQGVAGLSIQGPQGSQGLQGVQGTQGLQGTEGQSGRNGSDGKDGINGVNGTDGAQGPAGENGAAGPKTERRCNAQERRVEWRNEGDENWQPEYNLSPLQTCPTEG